MTTTDRIAGLNGSVGFKAPCRAATTAAITLSGEQTIDGVAIVAGDRVLVKNQSSSVDNGIYLASTGPWSRALDFNGVRDARNGTMVYVTNGSTNGAKVWAMSATDPVTVGTTAITFSSVLNITSASPFAQSLLDDANAAEARTTLGLGALATASSVNAATIDNGTVGTDELADQSVTLAKLSRTGATSGYVLQGNGAGSAPSWVALSTSTSGLVYQVAQTINTTYSTTTALIPNDDTIPQNTEGEEIMTRSITPLNASSTLIIDVVVHVGETTNADDGAIVALFQDSTADALRAAYVDLEGSVAGPDCVMFRHIMTAGTTSATTFKVRVGLITAGTLNVNGTGGGRKLGGVLASSITITEILP